MEETLWQRSFRYARQDIATAYYFLRRIFLKLWSYIPIVGELPECPRQARRNALSEVATTSFFATMPLWFPLIISLFMLNPPQVNPFGDGELLIYSAGLFGPLVYVINKRYGNYKIRRGSRDGQEKDSELTLKFPYGGLFAIVAAVACVFSGIAFTLLKMPGLFAKSDVKLDYGFIQNLSIGFFAIATLIVYCVFAYRNMLEMQAYGDPDEVVEMQKVQEDNFAAAFTEQPK